MSIKTITTNDLRAMKEKEGLILQGCGGRTQDWLDGINDLFTQQGLLKDGTKFEECMVFEHKDLTCILFPFEGVKLDMGKLALWRIQTREKFGGTWLSDYVPNRLGGFIDNKPQSPKQKPNCALIGADGNIFNLMGLASRALNRNGQAEQAKEMCERIRSAGNYYSALTIIGEYVNIAADAGEDEEICEASEPKEALQ